MGFEGEGEGVWVCVGMGVSTGEGGGGGLLDGKCGKELEGVVVGVCGGVGVRVPVVPGARVGGLVPFLDVNVAPSVTVMAAGGGFWVVVV